MHELQALLANLKDEGAPANIIKNLENLIEKRAMRIIRDGDEIRAFVEKRMETQQTDQKTLETNAILMFFLLILIGESNKDKDEIGFSDIFKPRAVDRPRF